LAARDVGARARIAAEELLELQFRDAEVALCGAALGSQLLLQDLQRLLRLRQPGLGLCDRDALVGALVDQLARVEFDELLALLDDLALFDQEDDRRLAFDFGANDGLALRLQLRVLLHRDLKVAQLDLEQAWILSLRRFATASVGEQQGGEQHCDRELPHGRSSATFCSGT
jgi:hypothetical protein